MEGFPLLDTNTIIVQISKSGCGLGTKVSAKTSGTEERCQTQMEVCLGTDVTLLSWGAEDDLFDD